jgi:hypothetical protein
MQESEGEFRSPSIFLLAGIYSVPAVFCWLILRKGFRRSLRVAVFTYMILTTSIGIIGRLG